MDVILKNSDVIAYKESNPTLDDIGNFMENPLCKDFYKKYLATCEKDSILFLMWVYDMIDRDVDGITKDEKMTLLSKCIKNADIRRYLIELKNNKSRPIHKKLTNFQ
jgi:hypothetical protein